MLNYSYSLHDNEYKNSFMVDKSSTYVSICLQFSQKTFDLKLDKETNVVNLHNSQRGISNCPDLETMYPEMEIKIMENSGCITKVRTNVGN